VGCVVCLSFPLAAGRGEIDRIRANVLVDAEV
jgi:hypothetical protein